MMRGERIISFLIFLVLSLSFVAVPQTAHASYQTCAYQGGWAEFEPAGYAIIYPKEPFSYYSFAVDFKDLIRDEVDAEFMRFESVFEVDLPRPITLRIYPDLATYECLNPAALPISPAQPHAHIGSREIAFILDPKWGEEEAEVLNIMRFEIAALMVEARTNGYAPPGLVTGIGGYAENPHEVFVDRLSAAGRLDKTPPQSWQAVWENPAATSEPETRFLATSIIAYLIEAYGWDALLDLFDQLRAGIGYREALHSVYGVGVTDLQEEWAAYFPLYLEERWTNHLFYSFDTTPYRALITAGAYTDTAARLREIRPILEIFAQTVPLAEVDTLALQAEQGLQAGALMTSARQALFDGDYEGSLNLANQAGALYELLGTSSREIELRAYLEWADEILLLRTELAQYAKEEVASNPFAPRRLAQIGERLGELGDEAGALQAEQALELILRQQFLLQVILLGLGTAVVLVLLFHRVFLIWRNPAPAEAELL